MNKIHEFIEKYKKGIIYLSIVLSLLVQVGGGYFAYTLYDKLERLERSEVIIKAKLKMLVYHYNKLLKESRGWL